MMCSQKTIDSIDKGKSIVLPAWLSIFNIVSPVVVLSAFFYLGSYKAEMDGRTFATAKEKDDLVNVVEQNRLHANSLDSHMPFEKKIEVFVPRAEMDYKFDIFLTNQRKIMDKLNIN